MRKVVVSDFDVLMVYPVSAQITRMNAVQDRLLDTRVLRVMQQMACQARPRDAMPEAACVHGLGALGMMKIQAQ